MTDLIVWSTMCTGEDWAWRQLCWLRELSHRVQTFSGLLILADINSSSTFTAVNITAKIDVNKPVLLVHSGFQPPFRRSISSKMVEAVWMGFLEPYQQYVTVQMESMNQSIAQATKQVDLFSGVNPAPVDELFKPVVKGPIRARSADGSEPMTWLFLFLQNHQKIHPFE